MPDAIEDAMAVDDDRTAEPAVQAMPPHLRRSSQTKVKRKEEPVPSDPDDAPAAKIRAPPAPENKPSGSVPKKRKPGPGRSSDGLVLLDGAKKSSKSARKSRLTAAVSENVVEVLEVAEQLGSEGAPIESVGFNVENASGAGVSNIEVNVAALTTEDSSEAVTVKQNGTAEVVVLNSDSVFRVPEPDAPLASPECIESKFELLHKLMQFSSLSLNSPVIFAPSAPIGAAPTNSASTSRWGGLSSTIFTLWVSALHSLPTNLLGFGSGRGARPDAATSFGGQPAYVRSPA